MTQITLDEVLKLPVPEQIRIVEAIWDGIGNVGSSWLEARDRN